MIETIKTIFDTIKSSKALFDKVQNILETPEKIENIDTKLDILNREFKRIKDSEEVISKLYEDIAKETNNNYGDITQSGNNNISQQGGKNVNVGNNTSGGTFTFGNISL